MSLSPLKKLLFLPDPDFLCASVTLCETALTAYTGTVPSHGFKISFAASREAAIAAFT